MPDSATRKRAAADKRMGKSASTQAGEYVKEEMDHIREGKHGARSTTQAIAIGLSKARRAGVAMKTSKSASAATRKKAAQDTAAAHDGRAPSAKRARATESALSRE
ncbi:MAG TPA: ku family containing domain-containing protein, partial [Casimicrobiaceae bacterium]